MDWSPGSERPRRLECHGKGWEVAMRVGGTRGNEIFLKCDGRDKRVGFVILLDTQQLIRDGDEGGNDGTERR